MTGNAVLRVENLTTSFSTSSGRVRILDEIGFELYPHRVHGILGESGCGKTVTNLSIMRLLPADGAVTGGSIIYR